MSCIAALLCIVHHSSQLSNESDQPDEERWWLSPKGWDLCEGVLAADAGHGWAVQLVRRSKLHCTGAYAAALHSEFVVQDDTDICNCLLQSLEPLPFSPESKLELQKSEAYYSLTCHR